MPRARNIKPGFFKDDRLVELAFEYRLLLLGLNSLADRAGRLEDRPKVIRMEVFPADSVNVEEGLWCLHRAGLILRYTVENKRYIQIIDFSKEQSPHKNERPSTIPVPEDSDTSTIQIALIPDSLIPDSLIPDSLIPDSPNPDSVGGPSVPSHKPQAEAKVRSVDEEVEIVMRALASVLGAKSVETMAKREKWRDVVTSVVREQAPVAEFLSAASMMLQTTEPRYFSPEAVLAQMQLSRAAAKSAGGKGNGKAGEFVHKGRRIGEFSS